MTKSQVVDDKTFKAELVLLIPHLRAFARSLAGLPDADDLAQEAMAKAWRSRANYRPGTNLKAWAFTILRNQYVSDRRRSWRTAPLNPTVAEDVLVANDDPSAGEELVDVRNAMQLLPDYQREALILAGPAGLSYEEAALVCGCAVGTVKSRVSRARTALADILDNRRSGPRARTAASSRHVFEEIMADATRLQRRLEMAQELVA